MIARFVITGVNLGNFMHTAEVKGYVYRVINGQKYEFPVFTGKIMHESIPKFIEP